MLPWQQLIGVIVGSCYCTKSYSLIKQGVSNSAEMLRTNKESNGQRITVWHKGVRKDNTEKECFHLRGNHPSTWNEIAWFS